MKVIVVAAADKYLVGEVVNATEEAFIRSKGGACLPVDPVARAQGVGFALEQWGKGIALGSAAPVHGAPITLQISSTHSQLAWRALLLPVEPRDASRDPKEFARGYFNLVPAPAAWAPLRAQHAPSAGPTHIPGPGLEAFSSGGWAASGRARISVASTGQYAFALYGILDGLRVASLAVSTWEG